MKAGPRLQSSVHMIRNQERELSYDCNKYHQIILNILKLAREVLMCYHHHSVLSTSHRK